MYLQLDTKFNPFTYDEMVKPLLYYKEAYDAADAAYSDLALQTEAWKDVANRENSPEAFEMYQRFSGDLERAINDFSQGMTSRNGRKALLRLKRRYAQDIAPIARASDAMNAANDFRAKAGPDAIFEVGEYNSIDSFLHGKTANNKFQSREALTKKTAAITEAAMAEALKDPDFQKAMGDQFWMITQHTGGSYDELMEAIKLGIMDNPIAQNKFSEIRQRVAKSSGIQNYDAAGQQAIMDAIDIGLYAGLDKPVRTFQANADHVTPAQAHSMRMQEASLALEAASSGMVMDENGNWTYDPTKDPSVARAISKAANTGSNSREYVLKQPVQITIGKDDNIKLTDDQGHPKTYEDSELKDLRADRDFGVTTYLEETNEIGGTQISYDELPNIAQELVDKQIKGGNPDSYNYYITSTDRSNWWTGDNIAVQIVPKAPQIGAGTVMYNLEIE